MSTDSVHACPEPGGNAPDTTVGHDAFRDLGVLRSRLRDLGAKPGHERALLRAWLNAQPLASAAGSRQGFFPRRLEAELPGLEIGLGGILRSIAEHPGADGSARLLCELADGETIESVLLPGAGLCVSVQVGCAVGCVFCMTGRGGLRRQLGSAEILAQVAAARRRRRVAKVVFMGMGEPAHNLDAVLDSIDLLGREGGIGYKNLVLSTVGDRRVFDRLPELPVKPALAISLHTMFASKRASLLPRAPHIDPETLVELGERYARATHYPIQYQWTLLAGVNDGDDELERIAQALAGKYAVMNFIPWNTVDGADFARPSNERALTMTRSLNARGVLAKLRDSAGQDVDGACGQLRARGVGAKVVGRAAAAAVG